MKIIFKSIITNRVDNLKAVIEAWNGNWVLHDNVAEADLVAFSDKTKNSKNSLEREGSGKQRRQTTVSERYFCLLSLLSHARVGFITSMNQSGNAWAFSRLSETANLKSLRR